MKFCTACQSMREETGGAIKRGKNWSRWVCKGCFEHKTESIYRTTGKHPADVAKLMAQVYGRER